MKEEITIKQMRELSDEQLEQGLAHGFHAVYAYGLRRGVCWGFVFATLFWGLVVVAKTLLP